MQTSNQMEGIKISKNPASMLNFECVTTTDVIPYNAYQLDLAIIFWQRRQEHILNFFDSKIPVVLPWMVNYFILKSALYDRLIDFRIMREKYNIYINMEAFVFALKALGNLYKSLQLKTKSFCGQKIVVLDIPVVGIHGNQYIESR